MCGAHEIERDWDHDNDNDNMTLLHWNGWIEWANVLMNAFWFNRFLMSVNIGLVEKSPQKLAHLILNTKFNSTQYSNTMCTIKQYIRVSVCGWYDVVTKTIANDVWNRQYEPRTVVPQYAILIYGSFSIEWHGNLHWIHVYWWQNDSICAIISASMVLARQPNDELLIGFDFVSFWIKSELC